MEKPQFIYMIEPARAEMPDSPTADEVASVRSHFAYLQEAERNGMLILAGRTQNAPHLGIAIFEADDQQAAEAFAQADPAVAAGVFRLTTVQPYRIALHRREP